MKTEIGASEEVLLAAAKLTNFTTKEFTEWDLTRETWLLNKNRWGLRGYETEYPDHKRVMNEIMAKGTQKIIGKGWLERIRSNTYRLTPLGLSKAQTLSKIEVGTKLRSLHEYDSVFPYVSNPVFENYCKDMNEPKTWLGAAAFLGLTKNDPEILERNLKKIEDSITLALNWLDNNNQSSLRRDDAGKPITKEVLLKLRNFLLVIKERFEPQFNAIRSKRK